MTKDLDELKKKYKGETMENKAIREGIEQTEKGLNLLLESVFPYGSIGALTGVLMKLVQELKHAYRHDYDPNFEAVRNDNE